MSETRRYRRGPSGPRSQLVFTSPASAFVRVSSTVATTFSGAADWQRILGTMAVRTQGESGIFSVSDAGVVTNISGAQISVDCALSVSASCAGNNKLSAIGFGIDGVHVSDWDIQRFIAAGIDVGNSSTHTDELVLSDGETVEALITNLTDGVSITVEVMVFSVIQRTPNVVIVSL